MKKRDSSPIQVGARVSIYRRGKTWQCNYQVNRRQVRKSLKTQSQKQAILLAQKIETELEKGLDPAPPQQATIGETAAAFLQCAEVEGKKKKTLAKYAQVAKEVEVHAATLGLAKVVELDARFADSWRASMHKKRKPKTIYTLLRILRSLVRFAIHRRMVPADPLVGYRLKKPKPEPQPCWTPDQAEEIITALPARYSPYLTFLRDTGCRAGEAKYLTWDDVDLKNQVAHIRPKDVWTPKTGDMRTVLLTPRLVSLMDKLPRNGRWVFCAPATKQWPTKDRQVSERRALCALKKTLESLGLDGHLHTFRHTFVSQAIARGVPVPVVRQWVGHIDPQVTEMYTHMTNKDSRRWLAALLEDNSAKP